MKKIKGFKTVAKQVFFGLFLNACFFCFIIPANAQPALTYTQLIKNLSSPVDIKNAGDSSKRLFIAEQTGAIRIYKNGSLLSKPFLNIASITSHGSEQGLLSIAFHPKYKQNGLFFVYYTGINGAVTLARYKVSATNADSAAANSGVILFSLPKPGGFNNHNGGCLHFGTDGYLYVTIGDGGSGGDPFNNAQNGMVLFGKMLRLKVDSKVAPYYTIPADNPFVGNAAYKPEIYALGLRNTWRWSFDRQTGDMWLGDVGQVKWEEVDFRTPAQAAGANYGWRCYEGSNQYDTSGCGGAGSYVSPIINYNHNNNTGGHSITGGYVYRGTSYPLLQGYYICSDYVSANAWKIKSNGSGGWNVYRQAGVPASIVSYGESEKGELYAASLDGKIYTVGATSISVSAANTSSSVSGSVINNAEAKIKIYPTLVDNHQITIELNAAFTSMALFDLSGRLILRRSLTGQTGNLTLYLPDLTAGMYMAEVTSGSKTMREKIYISR